MVIVGKVLVMIMFMKMKLIFCILSLVIFNIIYAFNVDNYIVFEQFLKSISTVSGKDINVFVDQWMYPNKLILLEIITFSAFFSSVIPV